MECGGVKSGTFARVKSASGLCVRVIMTDTCTYMYNNGQTGGLYFSYSSHRLYVDKKSTSLCSALNIYAPSHARFVCSPLGSQMVGKHDRPRSRPRKRFLQVPVGFVCNRQMTPRDFAVFGMLPSSKSTMGVGADMTLDSYP